MHIHILGIGGTLMGSIAQLARAQGHKITGSDNVLYEPMQSQLKRAGIDIQLPYQDNSIPSAADLIVLGNAGLGRGNPAVEALLASGKPFQSGAQFLGQHILADKWVIAAAGTHGKTTTASMIAWLLECAGLNPSYLIGGVPMNFETSARLTDSPFFVIEADEYDTSFFDRQSKFLHYRPMTLVINNLEYDHADIFPDLESIENQFHQLIRRVPALGLIIRHGLDQNIDRLMNRGCWSEQLRFGVVTPSDRGDLDIAIEPASGNVEIDGLQVGTLSWSLAGAHNSANALAAIAAARHVGVPPALSLDFLEGFRGVKRRLEVINTSNRYVLYDDFAHHPTAIESTLEAVRAKVGAAPIYAIIEPSSHTMKLGTHQPRLIAACESADQVFWLESQPLAFDLASLVKPSGHHVAQNPSTLAAALNTALQSEPSTAHIVIMSNGNIDQLKVVLSEALPHA